ncbi:MAG: 1-(5-phosphoribosyl)-5-[(5-phosphoribosylamino)methylideneamino]imidazole-4-carboxamide isomerase [Candidatus Omnitrophica bacterium]|nr:1-(5-phosphoribosyl)-5-[(5-phosphoribosylamino)methylideneamino]imidazole-4-carboxamide isomerase [Candidatus Omnitrophota bacterium]
MKIIPAVDIIGGKTVRLKQGDYGRKLKYELSPLDAARKWEAMGAEMLHVVDLDGAREGRPVNLDTIREIVKALSIPVEVGGGYRKEIDIKSALDHGVWRVVVGTKAFQELDFARNCITDFRERVILSADAKNFQPKVEGWEEEMDFDLFDILRKFVSFGAREIIYTDIQKDGMLAGPSTDHLERILQEVNIKLISAGGVKTVDHIKGLKKLEPLGLSGVIVGRALYEGTIDLREAIDAGKADNTLS